MADSVAKEAAQGAMIMAGISLDHSAAQKGDTEYMEKDHQHMDILVIPPLPRQRTSRDTSQKANWPFFRKTCVTVWTTYTV